MDQKELYERQVSENSVSQATSASLGPRETALLKWTRGNIPIPPDGSKIRIAELSVGDGQLSRALAQALPSISIDCVDISSRRLDHCRQMARTLPSSVAERLRFLELNLDKQFDMLEGGGYDAVIAIDVLEHVFDPFAFVGQCARILKPEGSLFLRVPNLAYVKRRLALLGGQLPVTSSWFETPGSFQSWKDRHGWDGRTRGSWRMVHAA